MFRSRILFVGLSLFLATAAGEPAPQLWGGLRTGMTPDEVLNVLRAIPGFKKATEHHRGGGESFMNVDTSWGAINIAGQRASVRPVFLNEALEIIEITVLPSFGNSFCPTRAHEMVRVLNKLLEMKYEHAVSANDSTYTNGSIQVAVNMRPSTDLGKFDFEAAACDRAGESRTKFNVIISYTDQRVANADAAAAGERINEMLNGL